MEYIYHYTSIENAVMYILSTKKMKFSCMDRTNDPCEWKYKLFDISDEERILLGDKFWEYQNCYGKLINDNLKFACFTIDDEYKGYEHPRMWAQYANNFSGVLLKFEKELFIQEVEEQIERRTLSLILKNEYSKLLGSQTINYIPEFKPNSVLFTKNQLESQDMKYLVDNVIKEHTQLFFTKSNDWKDEKEYRILVSNPEDFYVNIDGCLKEVILGLKAQQDNKNSLRLLRNELFTNKPIISQLEYCNGVLYTVPDGAVFLGEDSLF